ncbi:MAG: SH3 domain-containing protein, partial [Erysipelotrichaceae bacterium]|nr:SH3 domain-containing protein [Erysipelotrichaceae bacterium]
MNHAYFSTKPALTKVLVLILAVVLLFASYTVATEIDRAHAEEITTQGYTLCKSYVVIRQWASKRATEIGQLDPAEPIDIDGKTKDGYAHIVAPCDGWVWAGYITFSEPQKIDAPGVVTAKKRVAARRWCDGPNVDSKP